MAEQNTPRKPQLTKSEEFKLDLFVWLQTLVAALVILILVFTFVGRIISVDGDSMLPTLHHGDVMLVRSIAYKPKQGDVIVLTKDFSHYRGQPIVKRVIAVGGQQVRIDYEEDTVYVDGVALDEPYILEPDMIDHGGSLTVTELTVPEDHVYVLGDNRNNSSDSRHFELDAIDERYILGQAMLVLFPFHNFGQL